MWEYNLLKNWLSGYSVFILGTLYFVFISINIADHQTKAEVASIYQTFDSLTNLQYGSHQNALFPRYINFYVNYITAFFQVFPKHRSQREVVVVDVVKSKSTLIKFKDISFFWVKCSYSKRVPSRNLRNLLFQNLTNPKTMIFS